MLTSDNGMKRTVILYSTADGKCPVKDFLDALPGKVAQKVTWVLHLLEDLDVIPVTYFKKLTGSDEIWECRIQLGSNAYRLFCFMLSGTVVVLTHGLRKRLKRRRKVKLIRRRRIGRIICGGTNDQFKKIY